MKASVQIVTTNVGHQSRPSITVKFDSGRYMFNVPEGIQRFSYSQAIRFAKLRGIFLSRMNLDCIGGLPGLILTISDTNAVSRLNITAPTGITHYIAASHDFVMRKNIQIRLKEIQELEGGKPVVYEDETISVCAAKLLPESIPEDIYRKRLRAFKLDLPRKRKIVNEMFESNRLSSDHEEEHEDDIFEAVDLDDSLKGTGSSLCYIIQGPTINGKFDAKKAVALNVQGKDRGKLAKGETVTLDCGAIIYPHDVIGPEKPGSLILILDIPSKLYIKSLCNNATLQKVLSEQSNRPKIVIHQLGEGILDDPIYQNWTKKYCNGIQNVIISPGLHQNENPQLASSLYLDLLAQVDQTVFPTLPKLKGTICFPESMREMVPKCDIASQLMEFQIEPTSKFLPIQTLKNPSIPSSDDLSAISKVLEKVQSVIPNSDYSDEFVVPLGTGSAIPARYRNVSGTWFHHSDGAILFDAGEGTLGQIERRFGLELNSRLRSLKVIFVSHQHGDHQLGVASVIRAWLEATATLSDRKLFLIAPSPFLTWIQRIAILENLKFLDDVILINCASMVPHANQSNSNSKKIELLYKNLNLSSFHLVPVKHCKLSFAVSVQYKTGFKVSFSGDCRPSNEFAELGKDSDLLIHEATLPNNMLQDAIKKKHCTFSEAICVAERMNAKNVLLTHFSQRLPKFIHVPVSSSPCVIAVASDLMQVHLKDFSRLPFLNDPALTSFFGMDQEEDFEMDDLIN